MFRQNNRTLFVGTVVGTMLACLLLCGGVYAQAQDARARKTNVLLIVSDDLNTDLGAYGHRIVRTPNIDRLAERGVRFDRAYSQYPLCNPSRTSFLSGLRPETTGILDNRTFTSLALRDVIWLPAYFHQLGYVTAHAGKIGHIDRVEQVLGWSDFVTQPNPEAKRDQKPSREQLLMQSLKGAPMPIQQGFWAAEGDGEDEVDVRTAKHVVKLLEENRDKPFFIAAGFHRPHLPFVASQKYFDLYPPASVPLPTPPANDLRDIPAIALTSGVPGGGHPSDLLMTDEQKRRAIAAYYAAVSFMDSQVGVVLDALDNLKLADNTIVVFFSDHGFHLGEHGVLWRKMSLFEECARVPLIVRAPGMKRGVASSRLVELVDLYPTLLELARLPAPANLEGTSFAPLLASPQREWKRAAFTQVQRDDLIGTSIRTERYRYTEWGANGPAELYDHARDPGEYHNLANDPKHAASLRHLRRILRDGWRNATPVAQQTKTVRSR